MNKDLGLFTNEKSALVLIDYQPEIFEILHSDTPADEAELNVRLLIRSAKAFDVPIVLSTVGVAYGINSPTQPAIADEIPEIEPIDRSSMSPFEDQRLREAVAATGRKRLIIGGLTTEVCLGFAVVEALKAGYDVQFVTDAIGGRSEVAHRTAVDRLTAAGAVPNSAVAVYCELFRDWATPLAGPANDVINWYFREVPKVTSGVGVAVSESRRAEAAVVGAQ